MSQISIEGSLAFSDDREAEGALRRLTAWYARNGAVIGGAAHAEGRTVKLAYHFREGVTDAQAERVLDALSEKMFAQNVDLAIREQEMVEMEDPDAGKATLQNAIVETEWTEEDLERHRRAAAANDARVSDDLDVDFESL